jgi:hypothetical protein
MHRRRRGRAADYRFPRDSERPSKCRAHARKGTRTSALPSGSRDERFPGDAALAGLCRDGSRNAGPVHDGAPQTALCGLWLGSGWAAVALFDAAQPSRKPPLRAETCQFAGPFPMEPTGIEPVTSCLQNDTPHPPYGPVFRGLCGFAVRAPPRGYGGIGRDQAGFGQRSRAAAQTIEGPTRAYVWSVASTSSVRRAARISGSIW